MSRVQVSLDEDVFEELQRRARPLVDDVNDVLRRLLSAMGTPSQRSEKKPRRRYVTLSRGKRLPVGLQLMAEFQGQRFEAVVDENGIVFDGHAYDSPSAAARAAKLKLGLPERAAQTNGWLFWDYLDDSMGCYASLNELRQSSPGAGGPGAGAERPRSLEIIRPRSPGIAASGTKDTSRLAGEERAEPRSWR